jgi:hypothetical protein
MIYLPYTKLDPLVTDALDATGRPYTPVYVGGSDDAYWKLLSRLWVSLEDFTLVEHTVIVHPTIFDELDACDQGWCGYPHVSRGHKIYGLGCIRFRGWFTDLQPNALREVAMCSDKQHKRKHWCTIDMYLQGICLAGRKCMHETLLGKTYDGGGHGCHLTFKPMIPAYMLQRNQADIARRANEDWNNEQ